APNFNGTVTIPFTVTDNNGAVSTVANAGITVTPINDPPTVDLNNDNSHNILVTHQIGLFNTGVDNSSNTLALGIKDPHYNLISQPVGGIATDSTVALTYAWVPTDGNSVSNWIGSIADNVTGIYQYQTSFSLSPDADPNTVQIDFDISFDNSLRDILVNGVSTGVALTGQGEGWGFTQYTHVQLSGANALFSNTSANTITFVVENRDQIYQTTSGPTGIRIENMHATVIAIGSDAINHQFDYATIYVEGTPVAIASDDVTISDIDNTTIQNATVTLTNQQTGDVLLITSPLPTGISAAITGNSINLSGAASLADYQQAIKAIQFSNTTENPNSAVDRIITVVVNDGQTNSNVATTTIHVVASADKPTLDLNGSGSGTGFNTIYTANSAAVAIAGAGLLITDIDSALLSSVTVHISNFFAGDLLVATGLPNGITASIYDPLTGTITLSGNASPADYQAAIQHVTFVNNTANPDTTTRVVEVTVNDGSVNSNTAVTKIDVVSNTVLGNDAEDNLSGTNARDALVGNAGNDILSGAAGDDILLGGAGNDNLSGNAGDDSLYGGEGIDTLSGGAGKDTLSGGLGNDILTGGPGADIFVWNAGETGTDTITDFAAGVGKDSLNLADLLQGEHSDSGSLSSFLSFSYDTSNQATTITIDADKVAQGNNQTQTIVLQNVDLTAGGTLSNIDIINSLLTNGNLQTDA
ncbi:MAG: type I secretion C-terminal target domain-containing protein, partial [Methylococcales bacterium]